MTDQEIMFANEYVLQFFSASAATLETAVTAARYAGYDLSADIREAEATAKDLLSINEVAEYINAEIAAYRVRLSGGQRRNLWKAIRSFEPETPEEAYFRDICVH